MKWYWYIVIGVAVLVIGYVGYKMFSKKKETTVEAGGSTSIGSGASAEAPLETMPTVTEGPGSSLEVA